MAGAVSVIETAYELVMSITMGCVYWVHSLFETPRISMYMPHETEYEDDLVGEPLGKSAVQVTSVQPIQKAHAMHEKNTIMYAVYPKTPVYKNPTVAFDSKIAVIPYGALVLVVEPQGRFYRVAWDTREGWVLKEHLADRASLVYPHFISGEENLVDDPNTIRVRACIDDMFGLAHSEFPLQAGEYIAYKLMRKGIAIAWPHETPSRMPGVWHTLLRGVPGAHMSVTPRNNSILEYTTEHDIGHLAWVEAVFPDGSIALSEANYPHGGIYSERALAKSDWLALKPVFISILPTQSEV